MSKNMRFCYALLIIWAVQVQAGPSVEANNKQNDAATIKIAGTGTIGKNGQTAINLNVEISPGPAGQVPIPVGGIPGPGGARPTQPTKPPTEGPTTVGTPTPGAPTEGTTSGGTPTPGVPTEGTTPGGTPSGTGEGAPGEFTEEEKIGLRKHNEFRKVHQVPPMVLDRDMCDAAKKYAEELLARGSLKHSSDKDRPDQGENLSMGCSTQSAQPMEEAVKNWYNEVCDPGYDFANGGFSSGTGHFTQVVWKESIKLGIGRAEGKDKGMKCAYIVGRYTPAGNMQGDFKDNVPKGNFDKSYCNSLKSKRRKYYDQNGKEVLINTPFTEVDAPVLINGVSQHAKIPVPELLNSKKKKKNFVGSTHQ